MINEAQRSFIKMNRKMLAEIFNDKLTELTEQLFDGKSEERDKKIDAINVLRDWLREIDALSNFKKEETNNFI